MQKRMSSNLNEQKQRPQWCERLKWYRKQLLQGITAKMDSTSYWIVGFTCIEFFENFLFHMSITLRKQG